ncbi:hypothetical protein ACTXT7_009364 [Hymenolepis weldensis]
MLHWNNPPKQSTWPLAESSIINSPPKLARLCPKGYLKIRNMIYHLSDVALGAFLSRRHINLRKLNLTYGSEITFLGMAKLVGFLPSLQELRLIGCSRLNDAAIDLVCEHMRFLQVLEISANPLVTSAALATIGGSLSQLEYLSLDRCILITNEGLRSLEGLSNLQILTLRWCSLLTDEGLLDILKLRRLRFLSLAVATSFPCKVGKDLLNENNGGELVSTRKRKEHCQPPVDSLGTPEFVRRTNRSTQKNNGVFGFSPTKTTSTTKIKKSTKEMIGVYVRVDPTKVPTAMHAHEASDNRDGFRCCEEQINVDAYVKTLQATVVKQPWMDSVANGARSYVFQQESAVSHKALKIRDWMAENFIIMSHQTYGLLLTHQNLIPFIITCGVRRGCAGRA